MRYRTALLLIFCSCVAVAQEKSIAIFVGTDHEAGAGVLRSLQREAEDALGPSQVHISWHAMESSQYSQVYESMAMVRLRGECRVEAPAARRGLQINSEPLGQTQVVEGKVLPMADIRCDAVRRVIDRELRAAHPEQKEELLGRALGRVVAHELYHILLRSTDHGRDGLARPAQSSSDLLAEHSSFAEKQAKELSESLPAGTGDISDGGR
jgi:hypothetical protein